MLIDWFTVVAQAINFLVLILILKRLLFKPVLAAIDERQAKIKKQLADAAADKKAALADKTALQSEKAELDSQREALIAKSVAEAGAERTKLLDAAKSEAEALRVKLREEAQAEEAKGRQELVGRLQQSAFSIARKVLTDLASTSLETSMADAFAKRVSALSQDEKKALTDALDAHDSITVRSAMDLGDGPRETMSASLAAALRPDATVAFEVRPYLIGGVEVVAGGYRLDWNVANSLAAIAKQLGEAEPAPVAGAVSLL